MVELFVTVNWVLVRSQQILNPMFDYIQNIHSLA